VRAWADGDTALERTCRSPPSAYPRLDQSLNAGPAVKRHAERHAGRADANGWAAEVLGAREDQKGGGRHRVASSGFALQWDREPEANRTVQRAGVDVDRGVRRWGVRGQGLPFRRPRMEVPHRSPALRAVKWQPGEPRELHAREFSDRQAAAQLLSVQRRPSFANEERGHRTRAVNRMSGTMCRSRPPPESSTRRAECGPTNPRAPRDRRDTNECNRVTRRPC
jgi:hypothetical protein